MKPLAQVFREMRDRDMKTGPVKWCKKCSRNHEARKPCDLYARKRVTDNGRVERRWAH